MIDGFIRTKDIIKNSTTIISEFGLICYIRCMWNCVTNKNTTFLDICCKHKMNKIEKLILSVKDCAVEKPMHFWAFIFGLVVSFFSESIVLFFGAFIVGATFESVVVSIKNYYTNY